jgi:predicted TIM-barrel fold metal-dependent hydrolase
VMSGLGKPLGDPIYHPIYEAAAELDLSIGLHIGDGLFLPAGAHIAAGGLPTTRLEKHDLHMQPTHHHMMSFIVHGVFEKYPDLQLVVKETGTLGYFPWLLSEMDATYDMLRRESSWVRRRPSDYFRSNMWLTTQPFDESPRPRQLIDLLNGFEGFEDRLCFSTDYPHHDTDDPITIDRRLPQSWWQKVYYDNPVRAFGWEADETLKTAAAAATKVPVGAG